MYKAASLGSGAAAGADVEAGAGWVPAADWMGEGPGWTGEGGRETGGGAGGTTDAGWGGEGGHAWLAGGVREEGVFQPPGEEDEDAWAAGIEQWRD